MLQGPACCPAKGVKAPNLTCQRVEAALGIGTASALTSKASTPASDAASASRRVEVRSISLALPCASNITAPAAFDRMLSAAARKASRKSAACTSKHPCRIAAHFGQPRWIEPPRLPAAPGRPKSRKSAVRAIARPASVQRRLPPLHSPFLPRKIHAVRSGQSRPTIARRHTARRWPAIDARQVDIAATLHGTESPHCS